MLRVGTTGQGTNDSRWGTWWAKITAPAGPGDLSISEFRVRGPSGANDEFVDIFNPNATALTVTTGDGSSGYSLVASDGTSRFTIPNGTVIPARGHYLGVNSVAYSLSGYPAGNGTNATGDATYTIDIPDNAGIALFNTSTPANFALGTRIDAVGSTSEANTLYKEGSGYAALTPFSIDYSFVRSVPVTPRFLAVQLAVFPARVEDRRILTTTRQTLSLLTPMARALAQDSAWEQRRRRISPAQLSETASSDFFHWMQPQLLPTHRTACAISPAILLTIQPSGRCHFEGES